METGRSIGEDVIVTSGLAAGESVVTEGQFKLEAGMLVAPALPG